MWNSLSICLFTIYLRILSYRYGSLSKEAISLNSKERRIYCPHINLSCPDERHKFLCCHFCEDFKNCKESIRCAVVIDVRKNHRVRELCFKKFPITQEEVVWISIFGIEPDKKGEQEK